MKKRLVRLTENDLHKIVENSVKRILKEDFESDYNDARNNYSRDLWGMELKNKDGEWEYGEVSYDPNTQQMSCMGATIDVDPEMTVDQNLEALYDELMNQGYYDGSDE